MAQYGPENEVAGAMFTLRPFIRSLRKDSGRGAGAAADRRRGQAMPAESAIWYAKPAIVAT